MYDWAIAWFLGAELCVLIMGNLGDKEPQLFPNLTNAEVIPRNFHTDTVHFSVSYWALCRPFG
jgi:hypothetical protein